MNDSTESSAKASDVALAGFMRNLANAAARGLPPKKARLIWRNLIDRFPQEEDYACRYVSELLLAENWDEIDSFRAEKKHYTSSALDLRFIDAALARGDTALSQALISSFLSLYGNTPHLCVRRHDQHLLQGNFVAAEADALELAALVPAQGSRARSLAERASYLGRRNAEWAPYNGHAKDFDVYVINLDSDTVRMERVAKQLRDAPFIRIPGVKGSYLPDLVLSGVTQKHGQLQKGTVGCYLSHIVAWERIATSGRTGLVLEDDAWLLAGVPASLASIGLPADFDIVFANERMSPSRPAYPAGGPVTMRVATVVRTKPSHWNSPGTDGYFVSPKGARRLLALAHEDGITGDVDWRLLSYAFTERQRTSVRARGGFVSKAMTFHEQFHARPRRIKAYVLTPAIVRQFTGGSVRLWDNALPHSHLEVVKAGIAHRKEWVT